MRWEWSDGSRLQRQNANGHLNIPDFTVPGSDQGSSCGTVRIFGGIDEHGLRIHFSFERAEPLPECCCREYGWIQHESSRGGWRYDNGTEPAGSGRQGATSNPDQKPQGSNTGDRWDPNPWYGGTGNVKEARAQEIRDNLQGEEQDNALDRLDQDFERNPEPQTTIRDTPGGNVGFVTQLICVESGDVVFQYRWVIHRPRGERQRKFVGAEGTNLRIFP